LEEEKKEKRRWKEDRCRNGPTMQTRHGLGWLGWLGWLVLGEDCAGDEGFQFDARLTEGRNEERRAMPLYYVAYLQREDGLMNHPRVTAVRQITPDRRRGLGDSREE